MQSAIEYIKALEELVTQKRQEEQTHALRSPSEDEDEQDPSSNDVTNKTDKNHHITDSGFSETFQDVAERGGDGSLDHLLMMRSFSQSNFVSHNIMTSQSQQNGGPSQDAPTPSSFLPVLHNSNIDSNWSDQLSPLMTSSPPEMTSSPITVSSSDDSFSALSPDNDLEHIDPSINESMCHDLRFANFNS